MARVGDRGLAAAASALLLRTSAGAGFCLPKFPSACQGNAASLESALGDHSPFSGIDVGNASTPQAVDWDGDGDLDLIVGTGDGHLRYFERLPNRSLRKREGHDLNPFHHIRAGSHAAPQAVDWDRDGDLDLILGTGAGLRYYERLPNKWLLWRRRPDLNPFHGIQVTRAAPQAVDWDGDGDLDLILGTGQGRLRHFERLPDLRLREREDLAHLDLGGLRRVGDGAKPQAVDWDGDGDLDLIVGADDGRLRYFERLPDSRLRPQDGADLNPFHGVIASASSAPQVVDWDGDGELDLIHGAGDGRLYYFRRLPDVSLRPRDGTDFNPFSGIGIDVKHDSTPWAVDWDGDGDLDLVLGTSDGRLRYFRRQPDSNLLPRVGKKPNPFHGIRVRGGAAPQPVDWDGDGDVDLLLGGDRDGGLRYYERVSNFSLQQRKGPDLNPFHGIHVGRHSVPRAVDWDGDGDLDLILGAGDDCLRLHYYERLSDRSLQKRDGPDSNPFHGLCVAHASNPQAVDWDGDGDLDLVLGARDGGVLYLERLPNSSLRLRGPDLNPFHGIHDVARHSSPQAVDWDGDGDLDLILGAGDGSVKYYERGQCDVRPLCSQHGLCTYSGSCNCVKGYDGSDCHICSEGYHSVKWGTRHLLVCKPCVKGQSSAGGRDATCRLCGPGNISEGDGHLCKPCQASRIPTPDHASCVKCGLGRAPSRDGSECTVRRELVLACAAASLVAVCGAAALCWLCWRRWQRHTAELTLVQAVKERGTEKLRGALDEGRAFGVSKDVLLEAADVLSVCESKYIDQRFLIDAIRDGDLKFLKGSWLVAQTDHPRFRRQQDLPPAAFWTAEDLLAQQRFVLWIAVSYCWLHPVHPDPMGEHFRTLCHAIRLRMAVEGPGMVENVAVFLDYCSLAQHGERGSLSNPEVGVKRTAGEEETFRRGLHEVNVLYAHQLIEVWMMKWVPEDEPRKYMARGWPFFEQAVAGLIKDGTRLFSLDPSVQSADSWMAACQGVAASRRPPMLPDRFEEAIREKTFTNGNTDADLVVRKYRETFEEVVGKAPALWFSKLNWADEEASEVAQLLPRCGSLRELIARSNAITAQGAMALVKAAKGCPSLQGLDLSDNPLGEGWIEAIHREWEGCGKARERLHLGTLIPDMPRSAGHPGALDAPTAPLLGIASL